MIPVMPSDARLSITLYIEHLLRAVCFESQVLHITELPFSRSRLLNWSGHTEMDIAK